MLQTVKDKLKRFEILIGFGNRVQLVFNRILFPRCSALLYQLDELEVLVDHNAGDQDGVRSCLCPGLYDPILQMLAGVSGSVNVLDLGANGGGFLLALKYHGFSIGRAVAVELNPHTWSRLVFNTYRNIPNAPMRLVLLNGAAGAVDGELEVYLGRGSVSDTVAGNRDGEGNKYILPTYSLGTLLRYFKQDDLIDICKIDIEGAEFELLRTIDHDSLAKIQSIIIEIHEVEGKDCSSIFESIKNAGFRLVELNEKLIEPNVYLFCREELDFQKIKSR